MKTESILTVKEAATFLGVSSATIRNWEKHGYLSAIHSVQPISYPKGDIKQLKEQITNGQIKRLNTRANKRNAKRTFIPSEYLQDQNELLVLSDLSEYYHKNDCELNKTLLVLALNFLQKHHLVKVAQANVVIEDWDCQNSQIRKELSEWFNEIGSFDDIEIYRWFLNVDLPDHKDILGLIYQTILKEGDKAKKGSYYTPDAVVKSIVDDYTKRGMKVLDPCCGTGQFLLHFADKIDNPSDIYGFDIDSIAVRIARLNLIVKYKYQQFSPNIYKKDTLLELSGYGLFNSIDDKFKNFDIVATNPPWGVHFSKSQKKELSEINPQITSQESASYFIKKGIDLLKKGGVLSYILPEAILNIKSHRDIRKYLLDNCRIKKIVHMGRLFDNVFTAVIRLDVKSGAKGASLCQIEIDGVHNEISSSRFYENTNYNFDIHINQIDEKLILKTYSVPHTTLLNQADWALGIVTGNNKKYLLPHIGQGYEAIYRGKDIERFKFIEASSFIKFCPENFQQVAPEWKHRTKVKLVYRFISKHLIFAYDDQQRLTLNSANIVIPKIQSYPTKVILALFNSSLYQFIYQKKFSTIKTLRGHLEQLPLPLWEKSVFDKIISMANKLIDGEDCYDELDAYVLKSFGFSQDEIDYIENI